MTWGRQAVLWVFAPLLRFVESPEDSAEDRLRKTLLLPVASVSVVISIAFLFISLSRGSFMGILNAVVQLTSVFAFLVFVLVTKQCPQQLAGAVTVTFGGTMVLADIWTYGLAEHYTNAVLVMDILLLCNCHRFFTTAVAYVSLTTIFVSWTEQFYGLFGIYDAIPESWSGYNRPETRQGSLSVTCFVQRFAVFLLDLAMTRYFSKGMREQREQVERSVVVAQRIASALARFDLDTAQEMVVGAEGLPLELLDALSCLLGNLRSYKPYLPQSCLHVEVESDGSAHEGAMSPASTATRYSAAETVMSAGPEIALTRRAVTVVQLNMRGFLGVAASHPLEYVGEFHTGYINKVLHTVKASRGLVEHVSCDRVLISFNAAKPCASHQMQGLVCVSGIRHPDDSGSVFSMAISSGAVLCGPLGSAELRSYSMVGELTAWVPVLERIAAKLSVVAATDTSIVQCTTDACDFRLLAKARFAKNRAVDELYEFTGMKELENVEWMYQLDRKGRWDAHNVARRLLCSGDACTALCHAIGLSMEDTANAMLLGEAEKMVESGTSHRVTWVISDVGICMEEVDPEP